ncbi:MAG TPA: AMP-binding protein, partial [Solirubrobacter sp.]|nr:AMP-binding protein [Solirubrobacter sp.]
MLWRGDHSSPPTPALVDAELFAALERHASRTAIVDAHSGRALTFAQLGDGARRLAAGLATRGVGHRDGVAIAAGNGPDYAVALLGGLAAGAAVASANPALTPQELKHHFGLSEPRLVFAEHRSLTAVAEAGAPAIAPLDALGGLLAPPRPGPSGRTPDDPALLFPSSGTTGLPKLAVHTHAGTTAFLQTFAGEPTVALAGDDVVGVLVPFAHLFGTGILLHALRSGARAVTLPVADFQGLLRMIAEHGVTVAPVTPPVIAGLARSPLVERYDLSSLRRVICSAAPCSPALLEQATARLGCAVGDYLGITEAWCVAAAADPVVRGSAGRLAGTLEAVVVDPDSGARLGPGEPGELWVRGPQVMTGYAGAGPSPLDADGWLATGDLCR